MALSLLSLFNTLTPKDSGSRLVARDVAYGPAARHKLDIYAPRNCEKPVPVVFFVYGGSWMDGDRHNYGFAGRALAALGYVTVIADYRLVPEVEYPGFLEDGAAAFAWVAGCSHMRTFIAGATKTSPRKASASCVSTLSASPCASLASVFADSGAITSRSASIRCG